MRETKIFLFIQKMFYILIFFGFRSVFTIHNIIKILFKHTLFFLIMQLRKENSSTSHVSSGNTNYLYKKIFYINYSGIFCLNNLSWNHYLKSLARSKNIHARSIIFSIFIFFNGKYFSIVQYYTFSYSKYKFYGTHLIKIVTIVVCMVPSEWYI